MEKGVPAHLAPYRLFSTKLRKVIEYRSSSTAGMLCSHSVREGPESRYTERGLAMMAARSHLPPVLSAKAEATR